MQSNDKTSITKRARALSNKHKETKIQQDQAQDDLYIIYHGPDFTTRKPQHFASIIACKSDECYLTRDCAAIEIVSDGADLYFSNGRFRLSPNSRSGLHGPISIPAITSKLRSTEALKDRSEAPYVEADLDSERTFHFSRDGKQRPCERLQLLRLWNQFEDQGLSWDERHELITGGIAAEGTLGEFQDECSRAGLQIGQKIDYDKQFDEMDKVLRKLELMFWYEIEGMAELAFRNLGYPAWGNE